MSSRPGRRPKVSWLLNSAAPTGRAVMAVRRMDVLAEHYATAGFTLDAPGGVPRDCALRALRPARSLAGEARLARSDVIVSTSESSIASATTRAGRDTRVVHWLHDTPGFALSTVRFMRSVPRAAHVVVPLSVDPAEFARDAGLPSHRVSAMDDFVPGHESLPGSATAPVALAAGHSLDELTDIVDAFVLADLPGWQLRVLGGGRHASQLADHVAQVAPPGRILLLGDTYDVARHVAEAGLVVKLDPADVNGLPVLEALAAGVPVLGGSQVPAVRRFVRHDHNGVVLDRIDSVGIAGGLRALSDTGRRRALADNARTDASGLLTEAHARQLHDLFAHILDNSSHGGTR